ncbi:hypothetical protein [Deinococcus peraridilitoris]|uniref:Uncharacterized protein n=1 Tax=Deinococcus peraridilitoris (strain DSM 19664 / LMG 22246 / CIP 109416 / KR-200) TaxID=937777 RepID=L0A1T0_DEIPD|nr:hypothetical protein [Deinococcus peraridilitoris]AFZ67097.1 hypothetical protein Deipe_1556 [Deinococcus peraridilitoris DSM 19664]
MTLEWSWDAQRFDPNTHPWPACVEPWSFLKARPRDLSFGFVHTRRGKRHVYAGSWLVHFPNGDFDVMTDAEFAQLRGHANGHAYTPEGGLPA